MDISAINDAVQWLATNAPAVVQQFVDQALDLLTDIATKNAPTAEDVAGWQAAAKALLGL